VVGYAEGAYVALLRMTGVALLRSCGLFPDNDLNVKSHDLILGGIF